MTDDSMFRFSWMRVGGICGILGIVSYLAAAFAPLPDFFGYVAAFAFGPLVSISSVGLYHWLSGHRRSALLQIASGFGIAAGVTVLIMLTTQQAIFGVQKARIASTNDPTGVETYHKISEGLNAVHYGIDIAWDVLIATAVILFGIAMIKHKLFMKVFGIFGVVIGLLLLSFNLWYFPIPPANAGSIDWGPATALWMLIAFVLLLRAAFKRQSIEH